MTGLTGSVAVFGVALVTIGAAGGIGMIGMAAMAAMARQPEIASKIQTGMLITAGMIEGVALFAAVICLIAK